MAMRDAGMILSGDEIGDPARNPAFLLKPGVSGAVEITEPLDTVFDGLYPRI
jgi:hypothetical protein